MEDPRKPPAVAHDPFNVGDLLRSHDFEERERPGRGACYCEGKLLSYEWREGCWRYVIRVTREVWNGAESPRTAAFSKVGRTIFPPINGIRHTGGTICNFVEKAQ
jgi:hypothetical protein